MSWTTYTVYNFADDLHWPELGILLESIDGRVAVTVDLSDGRVAIIEQNTKQSNYLKLRISHTPDIISESWKLLWREQVISHM